MDGFEREYRISQRKTAVIPDRVDCPVCKKSHRVRQEGLMHFFKCKKNNQQRFFVGWNNVYMVHPPKETAFIKHL
jgi:hypothetical protein